MHGCDPESSCSCRCRDADTANLPRRSKPHTCLKPRNSNVLGFSPRAAARCGQIAQTAAGGSSLASTPGRTSASAPPVRGRRPPHRPDTRSTLRSHRRTESGGRPRDSAAWNRRSNQRSRTWCRYKLASTGLIGLPCAVPVFADHAVLHHPGPEPFADQPQDNGVGDAMGHHLPQPVVIDACEVPANVRLEDVLHFPRL